MRVTFDYPNYQGIAPVDVPDERLMGVWGVKILENHDEMAEIHRGMSQPIGKRRLREEAAGKKNALILVDDGTRGTPVAKLLPPVIDELHAAGLKDEQIRILTAQGTHRKMTDDELKKKLGSYFGKLQVHQHNWKDESSLHVFGKTQDGTLVRANRLLKESDFVMGIGGIVPHRVKGFSGGAKIAFPGAAGPEIMDRNQWEASMQMSETVMGVPENSMRLRMEEAGEMAGLRYIVNVVSDGAGKIGGCFCGDVVAAHRAGCRFSRELTAANMPGRADVLLIDSYPADRDFWQSAKGLYSGTMAVKRGGTIIMVSPNPEGVASNHKNVLEIGYKPHAELVAMVQRGEVDDLVGVAILADVAQILDHARCVLVSPGIKPEEAKKLGMHWAPDGTSAVKEALQHHGPSARIAVLKHGGHILPLADDKAMARPS
ncbi:MAG TPA: nickel-dependent lactate racemase [Phycisphaerae bacterium]|nr:nickel-dependent lactate racemase [Phycisphaerae bacterium]